METANRPVGKSYVIPLVCFAPGRVGNNGDDSTSLPILRMVLFSDQRDMSAERQIKNMFQSIHAACCALRMPKAPDLPMYLVVGGNNFESENEGQKESEATHNGSYRVPGFGIKSVSEWMLGSFL